jgi:hypothetical protein
MKKWCEKNSQNDKLLQTPTILGMNQLLRAAMTNDKMRPFPLMLHLHLIFLQLSFIVLEMVVTTPLEMEFVVLDVSSH